MLNAFFARSCWTVAILYLCCFIITPASTQKFSLGGKQYFLIEEKKSLDDAAALCNNRGQRLVQINSKEENGFVFNSIVKSATTWTWLGAANSIGTRTFKWLDGSELIYSNWRHSQPNDDINQRSGICMYPSHDSKWSDCPASHTSYFICETLPTFALHSNLAKQTDQLNATIEQLDTQLNAVFSNGTSTLRSEYIELIGEMKQSNYYVHDQLVQEQAEINSKLNQLFELNAVNVKAAGELSFNHTDAIIKIESSLQSVNESQLQLSDDIDGKLQTIIAKNVASEEKLIELIKGQVVEYSYLDKQYVLTREYNSFYSAVRICRNRNETLVRINSRMENEFIFNTIVKPSGHATWLGATNEIGLNTYKWVDGDELKYSNWDTGFPDKDTSELLNAILMSQSSGRWYDELATGNGFVLCERPTVFALQSTVLENSVTILEQSTAIKQLKREANEMAFEQALQKRQNADLISTLETRVKSLERRLIKS